MLSWRLSFLAGGLPATLSFLEGGGEIKNHSNTCIQKTSEFLPHVLKIFPFGILSVMFAVILMIEFLNALRPQNREFGFLPHWTNSILHFSTGP
jgi:hypothetical protein